MSGRQKKSFKLAKSLTPLYTGGAIAISSDGTKLYTTLNEQVVITHVFSGERLHLFTGDSSAVTTIALSPENVSSAGTLLVAHRSLALRFYSAHDFSLSRSIARAQDAPITVAISDSTGSLFATGSADGTVKVWDAKQGHCTHVFRGHGGVVSALCFDIHLSRAPRLFSASDDCRVRGWDLTTRKSLYILEGHSSVVRGLAITSDGSLLVSGGRDKVYVVWQLSSGTALRTIPVFETLEAIGLVELPPESVAEKQPEKKKGKTKQESALSRRCIWTAGDTGNVRLWDLQTSQPVVLLSSSSSVGKPHEITHVCAYGDILVTAHVDQNLIFHRLPSCEQYRHIVGYNDEIIDTLYVTNTTEGSTETHLAVATNSDLIRLYDLESFDTTFLAGHQDVVLCLSGSRNGSVMLSGSKDRTARIWKASVNHDDSQKASWRCIGICEGHLESIGATALAQKECMFAITASQDLTVKIWDMSKFEREEDPDPDNLQNARSLATLKVHDKDINTLDISPNDRLLATGSQDRSAKLFAIDFSPASRTAPKSSARLTPLGVFKGHKRGVWSVKFSPTDQCLLTASGDRTIKLWNINDFTCLKTFEGHTNTVLRVMFLPGGLQLASSASDGLVKIWNVKDEDCVATLDNHEEKIWALTCNSDASVVVSGGADSVISFWQDVTEVEEDEQAAADEEEILKQQDLANFMNVKDYKNAILLALSMNQPRRLFNLFSDILSDTSTVLSTHPSGILTQVLASLESPDVFRLLEYVRDWNAKSRDSDVAQSVLHILLKTHSSHKILRATPAVTGLEITSSKTSVQASTSSIGDILEAILPYTERHYARADKLEQESAFLDFVLAQMDEYAMKLDGTAEVHVTANGNGFSEVAAINGFSSDDHPAAGR